MKILFVCNEYPPSPHGGIGSFVFTLAHKLSDLGHQIFVLGFDESYTRDSVEDDQGVIVYRIVSPHVNSKKFRFSRFTISPRIILDRMYLSKKIDELVILKGIDIVESYDWSGPIWSKPKAPLVVRLHGANSAHQYFEHKKQSHLLRFFERRNIKFADQIIAVSEHIGKLTLRALNLDHKNYHVIYNGVDTNLFYDWKVNRNQEEILYVGSVSRRKGILELFQAYSLVLKEKPDTKLTLVGSLPDGEQKTTLISNLLSFLPADNHENVKFLGRIPLESLPEYYNRATIAVFPSLAEAFGLTCAEAMACGTPIIMTNRASGPELIENGKSGLLVDVKNIIDFSKKIIYLLDNPEICADLGKNAINKVFSTFDLDSIVKLNEKIYKDIIYG